jgi:hypothetical protein
MFDAAQRIADAVLYEGYVLYPYRKSSIKNRVRWQFGVIAPRAPGDDGEPWFAQTECLVHTVDADASIHIRVRALRPTTSANIAPLAGEPPVWLDAAARAIDIGPIALDPLPLTRSVRLDAFVIDARVTIEAWRATDAFIQLRLRLENLEPWHTVYDAQRDAMLARSLVGVHFLLAIDRGAFVSLLEPPADAAVLAAGCDNRHMWPVLVGDRAFRTLMLSSPIVLYDFPSVAKESRGDLCDAAEIDEILSLRILTMTDEEKAEARATDPRAREILDRVEALTPDALGALHGTMRSADFFNPATTAAPETAVAMVNGVSISRGSRVRLRPNRRADAMDMFLAGQDATVAGVYRDVDDRVYIAVTVDADPAASLHESFGRYFYFDPSEIEPADSTQEPL